MVEAGICAGEGTIASRGMPVHVGCVKMHRSFIILFALLAAAGFAAVGCKTPVRHCPPADLATAQLHDIDDPDSCSPLANPDLIAGLKAELDRGRNCRLVSNRKPQNYLALSGGGVNGTFTVGVLCGWSDSGKRPEFDVVTGISTGALIATYAFLGQRYDGVLRDYYSNFSPKDVYRIRRPLSILWSDSAVDSTPLKEKIDKAVSCEILAEVAAAHAEGRRLYIGTTNLDTRRLVIWDMGAIASSGRPDARTLFRDVILASASVPGFFPPVHINVEINGEKYDEMHVDGGTTAAVFFQPFMLNLDNGELRSRAGSNLYVIEAGKQFADPTCVPPRIIKIAASSLRTTLHASSRNDLSRLYTLALVTGVNYHLASVPQDFPMAMDALNFDGKEAKRLYDEGYRHGLEGRDWHTRLDNIGLEEDTLPRAGTKFQAVR
jgi:predicted patatin/cPLA2 family phospholipase